MNRRIGRHAWAVAALITAMLLTACGQAPAPSQPQPSPSASPTQAATPAPAAPAKPAAQPAATPAAQQPAPPAAPAKPTQRLSLTLGGSFTPNSGPPVWVAQAKGFLEAENLEVKVEKIPNFLQQAPALVAGKIDVLLGVLPAATTNMICQGADIKVVAGGTIADKDLPYELVGHIVRKDLWDSGEVRKIEDLAGRRLATFGSPEVVQGRSTTYYIDQVYGTTWGKTKLVRLPNDNDIVAAMANKDIDAAFIRAPAYWSAVEKGIGVDLLRQSTVVLPQYDMVQTTAKFASKNPEAVVRFLRAYVKAQKYLSEVQQGQHKNEYIDLMKKVSDVPENLVIPFTSTVKYTAEPDYAYNKKNHDHAHNLGVTQCSPPDQQMYDMSFLKQVQGS